MELLFWDKPKRKVGLFFWGAGALKSLTFKVESLWGWGIVRSFGF